MNGVYLDGFNYWMVAAKEELAGKGQGKDLSWKGLLRLALAFVQYALGYANRVACPARKALCLRLMNWLRADMARAA